MQELLLLLLPVAAASGWWAGRRGMRKEQRVRVGRNPAYFKGLNYLLDEQPDKAIDVFVKLLEVDSETVETHLALGNLFRRRGEVDRAIRIHQNLIARATLSREQRALALLELGRDYMRSGLFDRAESLFIELVEMGVYCERALSSLQEIYQQEKEWDQCLDVVRQLEVVSGKTHGTEIAHYHCEQAAEALETGDMAMAWAMTQKALNVDKRCVRATLMQGDMERSRNDLKAAITSYKQVVRQDADFIAEMLPRLIDCYRQLNGREELTEYLRGLHQQQKDTRAMLAFADVLQSGADDAAAERLVAEHLRQHADLFGLERFIALKRKSAGDAAHRETLDMLMHVVARLQQKNSAYQCVRCGFSARRLHWQCPGCKGWSTVRPLPVDGVDS